MLTVAQKDDRYEAIVRGAQAIAYWPLGDYGSTDIVGGFHFTTLPNWLASERDAYGHYTPLGINQVMSGPAASSTLNNMSIECWVRPIQANTSGHPLFSHGAPGSNGYEIETLTATAHTFRPFLGGVGNLGTHGTPLSWREWNQIVLVRDAGTWILYLNGAGATTVGSAAPTAPSVMQLQASGSGANHFKRLSIYDRVLSPIEIMERYELESQPVIVPVVIPELLWAPVAGAYEDAATVYVDIQVSGAETYEVFDSATILVDIQPSGVDGAVYSDLATISIDIQVDSHDCLTSWDASQLFARIFDRFETEANFRWQGTEVVGRFIVVAGDGLEEC